ncbi:hypothetical protein FISHEDRAFT_37268 [Fistulina hepatica ATCC 64428]|uniref:Gylcosyl hydrolase 115 C-terminal domain-containing protein n=1 Tax=Fistulina hepatica ATCC 64428 TaxID=1128425 RepID=A0A0D7AK87_9AGAR|nr:hypothetical protein FISHEDRAFT_37268 [Fistulina hepatica ATCC 64428]
MARKVVALALFTQLAYGLVDRPFISFEPAAGSLELSAPSILVDSDDFSGIQIAAQSLSDDFGRVTGISGTVATNSDATLNGSSVILVGSITQSTLISELVDKGALNVSSIEGKWESFVTTLVDAPFPGVETALVIAGSDKRGTIFGIYTLSESMGVSPWYFWADVVPQHHDAIYALDVQTIQGEPSVRYRGLFLNDEAPALTSWVLEHIGPKYNVEFYKHVFELLLRLKANYLWPAMWPAYPTPGESFFVDDPRNQPTADEYGIVMSTSHQEPMQRATNEWLVANNGSWDWETNRANVTEFFLVGAERAVGYESYFTLGMRGTSDDPIEGPDPMNETADALATQRDIIASVYGSASGVSQVWALYKEVETYYEAGLAVPDDVTLLFSDDNFGNIRRLPNSTELQRSGGIGLYYHFEYVGAPRSYKWINTNSLGKAQQQLSTAVARGADHIWIFNVGDLKPMETPLSMALAIAWNASSVTTDIPAFLRSYSALAFPNQSDTVASLLMEHSRLLGLRRHEHLESWNLSVFSYDEAIRVLNRWTDLRARAEALYNETEEEYQPSFYQLVLHPIKASQTYIALRVAQDRNFEYAVQRRNSANEYASTVLDIFNEDYDIQEEWNAMLNGKWHDIMRQTHYGYRSGLWQEPSRDMISGISYIQPRQDSNPAVGQMGVSVEGTAGVRPGLWNEGDDLSKPSRGDLVPGMTLPFISPYDPAPHYFEVFGRGSIPVSWWATTQDTWVQLSTTSGNLSAEGGWDARINITIDWSAAPSVPSGQNLTTLVYVNASDGSYEEVHLPVVNWAVPSSFEGFVESGGCVAMEAAHFTSSGVGSSSNVSWEVYPYLSRALDSPGAIGLAPPTAVGSIPAVPDGPWLEYAYYQISDTPNITVSLYFTMVLDTDPATPLSYGLALDDCNATSQRLIPATASAADLPDGWDASVQDFVWERTLLFNGTGAGEHQLKYWAGSPGVLLERIVVDFGGVLESYLGPPESTTVNATDSGN